MSGCASHAFHEHWRAGRHEEAAEAFRNDTTLETDARALYRMALLRLSPDLPVYDPAAARADLQSVLELEPGPALRREARLLLELTGRIVKLRDQLQALKAIDLDRPPTDTTSLR